MPRSTLQSDDSIHPLHAHAAVVARDLSADASMPASGLSPGLLLDVSVPDVPVSVSDVPIPDAPAPPIAVRAATASEDEANALLKAQGGDHQGFAYLYFLHKRRVYSLCLRMMGNVTEAEDLTQEAFLQLHRKIATFRGDSAFSTWLHRLTVNVVLMHLRRKGLSLISLDEAMDPTPDEGPGRSFGAPDLALTGSIDRLALQHAIQELPAGYRLVFVLHDIEGYEHNEIATMLNCSIGNSKSQLHKARLKLRDSLRSVSRPSHRSAQQVARQSAPISATQSEDRP